MTASSLAIAMLTLLEGPTPASGFLWDGKAIHPGCVEQLTADLADSYPYVAAVDLEGCHRGNRYSTPPEVEGAVLRRRDAEADGRGYFQYEYVGVLSSGVHVVRTGASGGGSGFFQSLVFVRIRESSVLEEGRSRTRQILELVGSESLGDRGEVTVGLKGDVVTIRRRPFLGAAGLGPEETVERVVR
jgi:hypothetical protein